MCGPNSYRTSRPRPSTGHSRGIQRCESRAAWRRDATGGRSGPPCGISQQAKQINARICDAATAGDIQALLNFVFTKLEDMSLVNMSTALQKVARMYKDAFKKGYVDIDDYRFKALRFHVNLELKRQAEDMQHGEPMPRCWSTISWVYGTLQLGDAIASHTGRIISNLSRPHIGMFKPVELSNLLWGLAKMQDFDELLFRDARSYIETNVHTFTPVLLSTIMWALTTGGVASGRFLHISAEGFVARLPDKNLRPGHISNVLWAMATAKVGPGPVLNEIGIHALEMLPMFQLHEVSIAAWAISRLGYRLDSLFKGIAELLGASAQLRRQVHPQGAANLFWAFEKQCSLGSGAYLEIMGAVRALLPTCQQLLSQLKVHEYTCLLRACTKLGIQRGHCTEADQLFFTAALSAKQYMSSLSERYCAHLLEAYDGFLRSPLCGCYDFEMAVPELVDTCVVSLSNVPWNINVDSIEDSEWTEQAPCRCNLMEKMLALVSSFPPLNPEHRRRLFIQVAQLAEQGGIDKLDVIARGQLARLRASVSATELSAALSQQIPVRQQPKRVEEASLTAAMLPDATSEQPGCERLRPRRSINVVLHSPPVRDREADMKSEAVINHLSDSDNEEIPPLCSQTDQAALTFALDPKTGTSPSTLEETYPNLPYTVKNTFVEVELDAETYMARRRLSANRFWTEKVSHSVSSSDNATPPSWSQCDIDNERMPTLRSQPDQAAPTLDLDPMTGMSHPTLEDISPNLPYTVKNTFVEVETDAETYVARRRLSANRFWTEQTTTPPVLEEEPTTEPMCFLQKIDSGAESRDATY